MVLLRDMLVAGARRRVFDETDTDCKTTYVRIGEWRAPQYDVSTCSRTTATSYLYLAFYSRQCWLRGVHSGWCEHICTTFEGDGLK